MGFKPLSPCLPPHATRWLLAWAAWATCTFDSAPLDTVGQLRWRWMPNQKPSEPQDAIMRATRRRFNLLMPKCAFATAAPGLVTRPIARSASPGQLATPDGHVGASTLGPIVLDL